MAIGTPILEGAVGTANVDSMGYATDLAATFNTGDAVFVKIACELLFLNEVALLCESDDTSVRHLHSNQYDVLANDNKNVTGYIFSFLNLTAQEATDIAKVRVQNSSLGTQDISFAVYSVSGILAASALDKIATGIGSAGVTAVTDATAALAQADELIMGLVGLEEEIDHLGNWTTGASYVSGNEQSVESGGGGAQGITLATAAEVVSATTAQIAQMTDIPGADWIAAIATYKGAAAAGGPTGVKTINDLAIASVKTINDLAIASVKTING